MKYKVMTIIFALVLVAGFAASALAASDERGDRHKSEDPEGVPFKASFTAEFTNTPNTTGFVSPCGLPGTPLPMPSYVLAHGYGYSSLGGLSFNLEKTMGGTGGTSAMNMQGCTVLTARNGDELYANYAGSSPTNKGTLTFTGGTGKFFGATGIANFKGLFAGGVALYLVEGTVYLAKEKEVHSASILKNPGFETINPSPWTFYTNSAGSFDIDRPGNVSLHAGHVTVEQGGSNVQLYQPGITLKLNTSYWLSFSAYSKTGSDLAVALIKHDPPFTSYGLSDYVCDLTTTWGNCSVEFTTSGFSETVNDARLMFWLAPFAAAGEEYFIDNVILDEEDDEKD